jgi:hypothetical protein
MTLKRRDLDNLIGTSTTLIKRGELKSFAKRTTMFGIYKFKLYFEKIIDMPKNFKEYLVYNSTEGKRLRKLKNIYAGKRCFIIGSGPSINSMDLTLLKNEFTFCLNAFILHKDIDLINPKCYISGNPLLLKSAFFQKDIASFLRAKKSIIKVFDYDFSKPVRTIMNSFDNVYFLKFNQERRILSYGKKIFDLTKELPASDSSVLIQAAIPLAVYMGFKKIILVGCDCSYHTGKDFGKIDGNHFYKESENKDLTDLANCATELYSDYWADTSQYELLINEWTIVKNCVEKRGIEIINAGVGGKLNVFRRVPYLDITSEGDD